MVGGEKGEGTEMLTRFDKMYYDVVELELLDRKETLGGVSCLQLIWIESVAGNVIARLGVEGFHFVSGRFDKCDCTRTKEGEKGHEGFVGEKIYILIAFLFIFFTCVYVLFVRSLMLQQLREVEFGDCTPPTLSPWRIVYHLQLVVS